MSLQALYAGLGFFGLVAEIGLFAILLIRRQYKVYPVFFTYIAFNLLSDVGLSVLVAAYPPHVGRLVGLALLPLQYLLELGVLFEIAWNVLRPVQASLPKATIRVFITLMVIALLGGILLAGRVHDTGNKVTDLKATLNLTIGLLRMLIFAATAAFAQLLGIGWKNKVLQLATALSFYSAADLIVSLAERHAGAPDTLEPFRALAYLLEIGFLVWAFTTKDVVRREFSPQMQQFLVTLAGRAKDARTALARTQVK